MPPSEPIRLVIHSPTAIDEQSSLAQQVASTHAELVRRYIQGLSCPEEQKRMLLDSILSPM